MKKYVYLGLCLLLIGIGVQNFLSKREPANMILRVAFPYDRPVTAYEPTKIHLAPEYIFLENIYSPLIELSKENGSPIGGIAKSFEWVDGELHLEIRDDIETIDGIKITAKDVEFSLKRLLILSENTHGNFKDLVCPDETLKDIESPCPGIQIKDNTLILNPKGERAFLVTMLASIDFAILPKSSVDPVTLKIMDYRNTSGPYFVESDDKKGHVRLLANKKHYNYSKIIPQEIQLVPSGVGEAKDAISLFKQNKVDFITTIDKLNPEKIISFSKESDENLHSTMNIRTFVLVFTEKGLQKFNHKDRMAIGNNMRKVFQNIYENKSGYEKTNQFFPSLGDGALSENESLVVEKLYSQDSPHSPSDFMLSIVRLGEFEQFSQPIKNAFPDIKIVEGANVPSFLKYKDSSEMPDCFIGGPDTGFTEDISLISYSMYAGIFGMARAESNNWLADYMNILDKNKRLEKLRGLHFNSLKKAIIVPLVSAPYVALARKPWKIELSQLYANNPLWPVVKR